MDGPSPKVVLGRGSRFRGVAIGYFVYVLATSGLTVGGVLVPLVAIATSINLVNMTRQSARFIEKYDSTRDQAPHTG
jgi:hypothetical protein